MLGSSSHELARLGCDCINAICLKPECACLGCAGPAEQLQPFVAKLAGEGVFTREVNTLGIAYHSPALEPLTEELGKGADAVAPSFLNAERW